MFSSRARSALLDQRVCWLTANLDAAAMHRAAQALVGQHDFSAFRDSDCQAPTPVRTVHAIAVTALGEFTLIDVRANAFLHHMVRNIAGVLMAIGLGKQPESWARAVLESRNRTAGGVTADAGGLYFVGPEYPAEFGLPPAAEPWFPALLPDSGARSKA
jgi:tRNA pseudouridine38-40 synthase